MAVMMMMMIRRGYVVVNGNGDDDDYEGEEEEEEEEDMLMTMRVQSHFLKAISSYKSFALRCFSSPPVVIVVFHAPAVAIYLFILSLSRQTRI